MSALETNLLLSTWKTALHQQDYRVTQPRLQVMEIIAISNTPLTPQDIYHRSLDQETPPGIASVYRTLEMLEDLGLIQQIHQPGGCHSYWPTLEGHQHLLICTDCGHLRVIEGNEEISEYISKVEEITGYQVTEHWLQLFGLCSGCSN